jgi:hypothetical protein
VKNIFERSRTLTAFFFKPIRIQNKLYWKVGDYRRWLADAAGEPPPKAQPDDENLMTSAALRKKLGGISEMTLWRWRQLKGDADAA